MRTLRTALGAMTAVAAGALVIGVVAPAAQAATGAAIRITEFAYGGLIATGGDGEYIELTNVGDAAQDMTGWSYANVGATPGATSLSSLGMIAAGESVILTDATPTAFRADWGMKDSVKVVSDGTQSLNKGPNAIHIYDAANAEVDSVSYVSGFFSGKGVAAWVDAAHLGAKGDTTGWTIATAGDGEGSWKSATGSIGSPGASTRGTVTPTDVRTGTSGGGGGPAPEAPCDTEDAGSAPGTLPVGALTWPGSASPKTIDDLCAWVTKESGQDLSGLAFDPNDANVLYAVKNKSHVYRLIRSGDAWVKDTANGWSSGKDLRFPGGTGLPDTEGITVGPDGALYITTERDNAASGVPLDSVLKFSSTAPEPTLVAADQWTLTDDLGFTAADANLGFEGVAYVPDAFLTAHGFRTDAGSAYTPSSYPGKALPGLFFAAVEKTGHLRAYALDADHSWVRVADVSTGLSGVMDVSYDPDLGRLWAHCDNTCGNATALLGIGADGRFAVERDYLTPANLPNFNLEGFAVAPVSTARDGVREVLWTDDGNRFGHSLWSGTIDLSLGLAQSSTPTPVISGRPVLGATLTAQVGTWDAGVETHGTWRAGDTLLGADGPLKIVDPSLVGKTITLTVTGSKVGFADATTTASVVVSGPRLQLHVSVSGAARVGEKLTAHVADSARGSVSLTYQWLSDGVPIAGGTKSALTLTKSQQGHRISVAVTGAKAGYLPATATSKATAPVKAAAGHGGCGRGPFRL